MREVEINEDGALTEVTCPTSNSNPAARELGPMLCGTACAWFQILDLAEVKGVNKDGPHAYCQNHCIGRIKT